MQRKILYKVLLALCYLWLMFISIASANGLHDLQDSIGTDKFAHAGVGYIISNELQHAGMSKLEAVATVTFIALAKEKWIDDEFSKSDIGVTVLGGIIPLYHKNF